MQAANASSGARAAAAPAANANPLLTAAAPAGAAAAAPAEVTLASLLQHVQAFAQQKEQAAKVQQDKEDGLKRLARETEVKHQQNIGELQGKLQQKEIELSQMRNASMAAKAEATSHKKNVEELVLCMLLLVASCVLCILTSAIYADPQAAAAARRGQ